MINLYIVDYYKLSRSGLSSYLEQLSAYVKTDDSIQLHFIWVRSGIHYPTFTAKKEHDGLLHYFIPQDLSSSRKTSEYDHNVVQYLEKEISDRQNIVIHFNWVNHAPFAFLLKRKIRCHTVLTKHCIPWRDLITKNYPLFLILNKRFLEENRSPYIHPELIRERMSFEAVDHVICVTRFASHSIERMTKLPHEKTSIIYNGYSNIELLDQENQKFRLREKYGFSMEEKILLYAGKIIPAKGVVDLVKAFEKVSEENTEVKIRLILAGAGNYQLVLPEIKRYWSKITITGEITKEILREFYLLSDIGIVPSYIEQCSYTAIEMMFHELPIIVSDVDGLKEVVPDDCGEKLPLVIDQNSVHINSNSFQESILYYLNHGVQARKRAIKAKAHAIKEFVAETMGRRTIQVYKDLVSGTCVKIKDTSVIATPLVSIILPCYNAENFLKECIESILSQSYTNFELIVINDGSTDNTGLILQSFKDSRISTIHNSQNCGISEVLNVGKKAARGKYIARIDADDMMHPDRLSKQVAFLEDPIHEKIALIGSYHLVVTAHSTLAGLKQYPLTNDEIKIASIFQNPFSHPSVMMRADVLKAFKYSTQHKHVEDYALWLQIMRKHEVANLPEPLTYYRVHESSISSKNYEEQKKNVANLVLKELDHLKVQYSAHELATHLAITLNYGSKYFSKPENRKQLENWLKKIMRGVRQKGRYSELQIESLSQFIRESYCGIY